MPDVTSGCRWLSQYRLEQISAKAQRDSTRRSQGLTFCPSSCWSHHLLTHPNQGPVPEHKGVSTPATPVASLCALEGGLPHSQPTCLPPRHVRLLPNHGPMEPWLSGRHAGQGAVAEGEAGLKLCPL